MHSGQNPRKNLCYHFNFNNKCIVFVSYFNISSFKGIIKQIVFSYPFKPSVLHIYLLQSFIPLNFGLPMVSPWIFDFTTSNGNIDTQDSIPEFFKNMTLHSNSKRLYLFWFYVTCHSPSNKLCDFSIFLFCWRKAILAIFIRSKINPCGWDISKN